MSATVQRSGFATEGRGGEKNRSCEVVENRREGRHDFGRGGVLWRPDGAHLNLEGVLKTASQIISSMMYLLVLIEKTTELVRTADKTVEDLDVDTNVDVDETADQKTEYIACPTALDLDVVVEPNHLQIRHDLW